MLSLPLNLGQSLINWTSQGSLACHRSIYGHIYVNKCELRPTEGLEGVACSYQPVCNDIAKSSESVVTTKIALLIGGARRLCK